jgi:O-antigen ligase
VVGRGRGWLLAAPLLAVVLLDPWGLAPYGPLRWAVLGVSLLAAAAVLARRGRVRWRRGTLAPWGAFLLVVAVSAAGGLDRLYAWTGTPERHLGAATWLLCGIAFVVGQQVTDREGATVLRAAVGALAVTGGWAVAEALGWEPIRLAGAGDRPVGTLGSSAFLGAAAALLAPVALGLAGEQAGRARRASLVVAALGTAALVASGARAAWVGALVAGAVVLVARRGSLRMRGRRPVVVATGTVVAVLVVGLLTGVGGRVSGALDDRAGGGVRGRIDEWRVAVRVVADHPVLGVGPEGYRIAFGRAVDDAYERAHGRAELPDRAHSAPLDVAASLGLAGAATYGWVVVAAGRRVLRALRGPRPLLVGAAAGLLAYAVQSLFLFPLADVDPAAWLLAGVVLALSPGLPAGGAGAAGAGPVARRRLGRPAAAVTAAVLGAGALAALVAGGLDVVADHRARHELDRPVPGTARRAADLRPDQVRYWLVAERVDEPTDPRAALADVERALAVSPADPVVRGEQARLLLDRARRTGSAADVGRATTVLRRLADDDPRNAEVQLRLGLALALGGDDAGARSAWRRAEHLAPRSAAAATDLAVSYLEAGDEAAARAAAERALAVDPGAAAAREVLDRLDARARGGGDGGPGAGPGGG